jgi:hypothetical protein
MIYPATLQSITEAIAIRDCCAEDHPKVVFLAFIGRADDMVIDGDWQQHRPIIDELLSPPAQP